MEGARQGPSRVEVGRKKYTCNDFPTKFCPDDCKLQYFCNQTPRQLSCNFLQLLFKGSDYTKAVFITLDSLLVINDSQKHFQSIS